MASNIKEFIDDEALAAEDWKCMFFITLTMLVITLGFLINCELDAPMDYCNADFCVRILGDK